MVGGAARETMMLSISSMQVRGIYYASSCSI
jgi:hypothetical protein